MNNTFSDQNIDEDTQHLLQHPDKGVPRTFGKTNNDKKDNQKGRTLDIFFQNARKIRKKKQQIKKKDITRDNMTIDRNFEADSSSDIDPNQSQMYTSEAQAQMLNQGVFSD